MKTLKTGMLMAVLGAAALIHTPAALQADPYQECVAESGSGYVLQCGDATWAGTACTLVSVYDYCLQKTLDTLNLT